MKKISLYEELHLTNNAVNWLVLYAPLFVSDDNIMLYAIIMNKNINMMILTTGLWFFLDKSTKLDASPKVVVKMIKKLLREHFLLYRIEPFPEFALDANIPYDLSKAIHIKGKFYEN